MKLVRLIMLFSVGLILFGCSPNEVIKIGSPIEAGIEFHTEITDKVKIEQIRSIFSSLDQIHKPDYLNKEADTVILLNKDSVSEIWAYIWYLEDGTAITMRPIDNYYIIPQNQTNELKAMLN